MSDEVDDALLHERLQGGALEVSPSTEESKTLFQSMIVRAEREAQVKPRRLGMIVSGSLMAAVLLGGATVPGVINVFRHSSPVQVPLFEYEYTLPSGAHCEGRFGVFGGADADAVDMIRRDPAVSQLVNDVDISAAIAELRANPDVYITDTGAEEPAGYGTKHYNADAEYQDAVQQTIRDGLQVKLTRGGFGADSLGLNSWGEDSCPGEKL